jgi:hypothetical protein
MAIEIQYHQVVGTKIAEPVRVGASTVLRLALGGPSNVITAWIPSVAGPSVRLNTTV